MVWRNPRVDKIKTVASPTVKGISQNEALHTYSFRSKHYASQVETPWDRDTEDTPADAQGLARCDFRRLRKHRKHGGGLGAGRTSLTAVALRMTSRYDVQRGAAHAAARSRGRSSRD